MTWATATALVGVVGGMAVSLLGYRRSRKVDAVSAQSGIASETRAGTAQVIDALNALLDQVQEDNKEFRAEGREFKEAIRQCADHLTQVSAERDEARRERDEARQELVAFRQRFGPL